MKKELQKELSEYFDISGIIFKSDILSMLKKFEVEAFPYEHS